MDQERNDVREVEMARERVAEDVRSVAENANVVKRAKEAAQDKVEDAKGMVRDRVQGARDALEGARSQIGDAASRMNLDSLNPAENPLGMMLAGLAVGFLIGLMLPVTRFESERIGPIAEDMKDRVRQAGNEAVRRGSAVIKDTIEAGKDAAATSLREQTRDMSMGGGEPSSTTQFD